MFLSKLVISLCARLKRRGVPPDLDESIDLDRAALALHPAGHPNRSDYLNNLGINLYARFEERGVLPDLDEAIVLHQAALALRPPGHSDQSGSLHNLAICLHARFHQRGVLSDLNEAIDLDRAALALYPPGHSNRSSTLNNLATDLYTRFEQRGILSDLDEAINLNQAALALQPPGHSNRYDSLNNLAIFFFARFQQRGVLSDLDEAIDMDQVALALCPPGHPGQSDSLNNLAIHIFARFQQRGVLSDLEETIDLDRAALALRFPGNSNQSNSLNNLAIHLFARFEQRGVLSDLNEAIDLDRAALALRPPGHFYESLSLNSLAICLYARFEQRGILSDLDEAIDLDRAALALRPPGHSTRSECLNNLAIHLSARFQHRGVLSDLEEAIDLDRAALALHPPGHSNQSDSFNNLATDLHARFQHVGGLSDLDEAIDLHRAALALRPPGHSNRSDSLNNLATNLHARFEQRGVLSDLDEAIHLDQAALVLCPPGHSHRSNSLHDLATVLHARFEQRGVLSDLDEAINLHRAALALRPPGNSNQSQSIQSLAFSILARFKKHAQSSDLNDAFNLFGQLSQVSHAVSHGDLHAAKSWTISAEELMHSSALDAYQTALKFLDDWQHVTGLSSSSHHFDVVRKATSSLAMDAFSCSVRYGAFKTAVVLVEQGRAVFWTQLAHFQTPLDGISASGEMGKALVTEFQEVSHHLRAMLEVSSEDRTSQIHQLTMQRDDVISRIRTLPDFSRFLLPPLFSDLQTAAEDGPVIIVNASQYSCDAMIVLCAADPVHIPFDIAQADVSELSTKFQSLIRNAGSSDNQQYEIVNVLRTLWECVVGPIVEALRELLVRPGSRIWWCPTAEFTLLPLHAAGLYSKTSYNLSRFYISSYTPTLAALIRARQQLARTPSTPHFAAIGQGKPYEGEELAHVAAELGNIAHRVEPILPFTSLSDGDATVQRALDALSRHQWVHLACHGIPNREKPFDSSFAMRDGPLTITDIIRPRQQNPEFAFLSACHTTVGHKSSPDESIHLAAAMQFSGFRSVIGSMWSVDDKIVGQLVSAFYENMVDGSGKLDCRRAAVALHAAVKKLRKKIPLEQQIVLVHIGV
jgi:CHAT domain-containing protein/tetratricopeptide (TPR) repeat protein